MAILCTGGPLTLRHGEHMKPLKEMDAPDLADELLEVHPQLESAVTLAFELHDGQHRKPRRGQAAPPYVEHPLRVAARLARLGVSDTVTLYSAVLHDTVEDCEDKIAEKAHSLPCRDTSLAYLTDGFGASTAFVVTLLTNPIDGPYFEHVVDSVQRDPRALLVKISDWLDNAGSLHHTPAIALRMVPKYIPLTSVYLEQLDNQYADVQVLLNGHIEDLRASIIRAGFRLEWLNRHGLPDPAEAA